MWSISEFGLWWFSGAFFFFFFFFVSFRFKFLMDEPVYFVLFNVLLAIFCPYDPFSKDRMICTRASLRTGNGQQRDRSWTVTDGLAHCYLTWFTPELIVFFICDYYWLILVYKGYGIGLAFFFSFWTRTGQLNLGQGGIMSVTVYDLNWPRYDCSRIDWLTILMALYDWRR